MVDDTSIRAEIQRLHRLATDAHNEGQFKTAHDLLEKTCELALRIEDTQFLIRERYWLSEIMTHLGENEQALAICEWLISLPQNPTLFNTDLNDESQQYIVSAYSRFAETALSLKQCTTEEVYGVIDRGLQFVSDLGKSRTWTADLHRVKGRLLTMEFRTEQAIQELETALALKRRDPSSPGGHLSDYLMALAMTLIFAGRLEESAQYLQEVIEDGETYEERKGIARILLSINHLNRDDVDSALGESKRAIEQLELRENPSALLSALTVFIVALSQKDPNLAMQEAIRAFWKFRALSPQPMRYLLDGMPPILFTLIRVEQARRSFPAQRSLHYLAQANRFLSRGKSVFYSLEQKTGSAIWVSVFLKEAEEKIKELTEFYQQVTANRRRWVILLAREMIRSLFQRLFGSRSKLRTK